MPCFCKDTTLAALTPKARLSVVAVPPQLNDLLGLLDLEPVEEGMRVDEKIGEALPPGGPSWLRATLSAQAPGVALPKTMPTGGGAVMSAVMRLSVIGQVFPLTNPRMLLAHMQQAALSLAAHLAPQMRAINAVPPATLQNMALAARLTLALRKKGVCPMVLARAEVNATFAASTPRVQAALNYAATIAQQRVPPFALPAGQLVLAQKLSALAPLGGAAQSSGMPPVSDPKLMAALKAQVKMLAAMPVPRVSVPPEVLAALADLDAILEAFGPDALTPAGVARVNAMLRYVARIKLPKPQLAASLSANLKATPALPDVLKGLETARTSGAMLAASASATVKLPPIVDVLEPLSTLSSLLTKSLGKSPFGPCAGCAFPLEKVAASVANVAVPDAPAGIAS